MDFSAKKRVSLANSSDKKNERARAVSSVDLERVTTHEFTCDFIFCPNRKNTNDLILLI